MAWNTISTSDVLNEFTAAEQAALQGIQGATTELAAVLARVVAKMRSQIKAGGNQLDMTGQTIPDGLQEEAVAVARWRWLNSFPAMAALKTKERREAYEQAAAMMKEVSSNEPNRPRTELPPIVDTTAAPVDGVQVARRQKRQTTRKKFSGFI
ncbi:MAG TPA: hypothetical protein VGN23_07535 [Verrucomicrobiae bacterium]|jgi:hypothetical protein